MDDLISRQQAIDTVLAKLTERERRSLRHIWTTVEVKYYISKVLEQLPSAQPVRKGRWIKLDMHAHLADHKCTACGQECYVPTCMGEPMYTYCPNCGADMRGDDK